MDFEGAPGRQVTDLAAWRAWRGARLADRRPFALKRSRGEGYVRLVLRGELDLRCARSLRSVLGGLIDGGDDVVVDLSELAFMDTQGLAAIIDGERRAAAAGRGFALVAGPRCVHRVFEATGTLGQFVFVDREAAGRGVAVPAPG